MDIPNEKTIDCRRVARVLRCHRTTVPAVARRLGIGCLQRKQNRRGSVRVFLAEAWREAIGGYGPGDLITVEEAAVKLGCSTTTVYRMIQEGTLTCVRLGPPNVRCLIRVVRARVDRLVLDREEHLRTIRRSSSRGQDGRSP